MADSAKVRLVRCPKCENLLPELADYSVYQCGGCGAVLRAKAKRQESEKSDEEMPSLASSRLENSSEKSSAETINASELDVKLNSRSFRGDDNRTQPKEEPESVVENGSSRRDKLGRELGDPNPDIGSRSDSRRSGRMSNWKMEDFGRLENVRASASNHRADEGPSKPSHQTGSSSNGFGGGSRALYLEQDRAALLMKLDELRDQLSRSCEVSDRPFNHVVGSPNLSRFAEPVPYNNNNNSSGYEMPGRGFYPSVPYPSHSHGYGDHFGPQIHKGGSHHFPRPYPQQQQPSHPYFPGQYMENNPDPFEPYSHHGGPALHHQPSCACFQCYEKHRRAPAPVAPPPPPPMHHTRWPSDFNHHHLHDAGPASRTRGRRVVVYAGARRRRPVGGGAPFLACTNCFEVLKLPKRVNLEESTQSKLKCGACSAIMNLDVVDKRLLSANSEVSNGFGDVTHNSTLYSHGRTNRSYAFSSEDYDNSGYDFQAMDKEPVPPRVGKPLETESLHSSSPCTSEDKNSSEIPIAKREIGISVQQPTKTDMSPPPAGSPLQDHFDFSTKNRLANRLGKGNQSSRSDQEKVKPNQIKRQNSLNKASMATEMEVSFNEYSNAGLSQDSGDASKAEDPIRTIKGSESFFSNIIKKSFKDFSRSNQGEERSKSNVSVNGHFITDRVLKKARKQAGNIHPGNYWYDYRAGFWGIMGGPCLGIVLPYIEEFNYPMPENCAGGTTGVYVNGRELHQKDLDLLSSRGLPISRDRSYIIEISGRVLNEDTGEELDCLGKLAPTVEKAKHGFGMKAPKVLRSNN